MRFLCPHCQTVLSGSIGAEIECSQCHAKVEPPPDRFAPGSVIGDFAIVREIAQGGVGVVYLARQISLDRPAALKCLKDRFAGDKEFVDNFVREARVAARISHPNVVQAYAVGEEDGVYYFAMEYLDGETMKQVLKREKVIEPRRAAEIVSEIALALDCAWNEQKLVHHDIKPDNIMLTTRGQAKLADLGLAQVASEPSGDDGDEVMGTPQYISPEQLTGAPTDVRSDIYSLGATFYHLVTGRFPYLGKDGNEIARQHVEGTLTEPRSLVKDLPPEVNRIILKMMEKDISRRYQSAAEVADDLKAFLDGGAGESKPKIVLMSGGGANGTKPVLSGGSGARLGQRSEEAPRLGGSAEKTPRLNQSEPTVVAAPAAASGAKPTIVPPAVKGGGKPAFGVKASAPPQPGPPAAAEQPAAPGARQPGAPAPRKRGALSTKSADSMPPPAPLPAEEKLAQELAQKPEHDWTPVKKALRASAAAAAAVIALVAGIYVLLRSGKTPESCLPAVNKVLAAFNYQAGKDGLTPLAGGSGAPAGGARTPTPARRKPAEVPKPVTRPAFMSGIDEILAMRRATSGEAAAFLRAADGFFASYTDGAKTAEERAAWLRLVNAYGGVDERHRMEPMRRTAHKEQEAAVARRRREAERRKEQQAARLEAQRKAVDDASSAMQKIEDETNEDAMALRAKLMVRARAYFGQLDAKRRTLLAGFRDAAGSADPSSWLNLRKELASENQRLPVNALPEERTAADEISRLAQALEEDFQQTRAALGILNDPKKLSQVSLEISRRRLVLATRLDGPFLVTRTSSGQEIRLNLNNAAVFANFSARFGRKFKIKNAAFYVAMASEQYQFCGDAPDAAVTKALPEMFTAVFAERWKHAGDREKAAMRDRYGKMPEFRQAVGE